MQKLALNLRLCVFCQWRTQHPNFILIPNRDCTLVKGHNIINVDCKRGIFILRSRFLELCVSTDCWFCLNWDNLFHHFPQFDTCFFSFHIQSIWKVYVFHTDYSLVRIWLIEIHESPCSTVWLIITQDMLFLSLCPQHGTLWSSLPFHWNCIACAQSNSPAIIITMRSLHRSVIYSRRSRSASTWGAWDNDTRGLASVIPRPIQGRTATTLLCAKCKRDDAELRCFDPHRILPLPAEWERFPGPMNRTRDTLLGNWEPWNTTSVPL